MNNLAPKNIYYRGLWVCAHECVWQSEEKKNVRREALSKDQNGKTPVGFWNWSLCLLCSQCNIHKMNKTGLFIYVQNVLHFLHVEYDGFWLKTSIEFFLLFLFQNTQLLTCEYNHHWRNNHLNCPGIDSFKCILSYSSVISSIFALLFISLPPLKVLFLFLKI